MQKSESIIKLIVALTKAKKVFLPLIRNQENPGFKRNNMVSRYADLAQVIEVTETPLLDNGLVLTQFPHNEGERIGVQNMLVHESGEFLEHTFTLPIIKQDAQTGAAAVTYARRVSMKAILGISDEDDDGNTASGTGKNTGVNSDLGKYRGDHLSGLTTAPAQAPKAEIPNSLPGSAAATNSTTATSGPKTESAPSTTATTSADPAASTGTLSSEMPTETQLVEFRKQFKQLGDDLATAGLKAGRGLPINRKVLAFLLKTTGAKEAGAVNLAQWTNFFHKVELTKQGEGGIKRLVTVVNEANEITGEKK